MPSDYFKDHWYSTFWFERARGNLQALVDAVGEDNILFETDFPHPTCLYPDSLAWAAKGLEGVAPEVQRKVLQDNAAALYRIPLPA